MCNAECLWIYIKLYLIFNNKMKYNSLKIYSLNVHFLKWMNEWIIFLGVTHFFLVIYVFIYL